MQIEEINRVIESAELATRQCCVLHGSHVQYCNLGGKTVGQIRRQFQTPFNIPKVGVSASVKGKRVSDDHILQHGQTLVFIKESGFKGLSELLTPEQLINHWMINQSQYDSLIELGLPKIIIDSTTFHPEEAVEEWFRQLGRKELTLMGQVVDQHSLVPARLESPYLNAQDATDYLRITTKSLYGLVERGHIKPLRGPKRQYRFTRKMLDEYLSRRGR